MAHPAPHESTDDSSTSPSQNEERRKQQQQQQQQQQEGISAILTDDQDEQYNSEEDPDFDINAPTQDDDGDEDSGDSDAESGAEDWRDEQGDSRPRKKRKVVQDGGDQKSEGDDEAEYVMGELESGDEFIIREGEKRKEKKKKGKGKNAAGGDEDDDGDVDEGGDFEIDDDDDEVGGEGGFVKTRSMKMRTQEERRPLAKTDGATIDVDALWAEMNANPNSIAKKPQDEQKGADGNKGTDASSKEKSSTTILPPGEETITIKRTYKFAGEVITEEKVVPKDSAEAKLYLSTIETTAKSKSTAQNADAGKTNNDNDDKKPPLRRPLRRISRFDPNPPDAIKKSWAKQTKAEEAPKGPKLNTVMKSKLDWAAYVDREGIKDELDVHSRAKDSYLNRTDFLNRTEARREEELRNIRLRNLG
ncbi:hypothetical protein VTO42DRAFT_2711 [Malbranchea cinnamomea]